MIGGGLGPKVEFGYVLNDAVVYPDRQPFTNELTLSLSAKSILELFVPRMYGVLDIYGGGKAERRPGA